MSINDDFDSAFKQAQKDQDNLMKWLSMVGVTLGISQVLNKLSPKEQEKLLLLIEKQSSVPIKESAIKEAPILPKEFSVKIPKPEFQIKVYTQFLDKQEISQYKQMMQEFKQYGRIMDPQSIENKAFMNIEKINEMIGQFGYNEATNQGMLEVYNEYLGQLMVPVDGPQDESTCQECWDMIDEGPYYPDEFPEPPHYGCRHGPGDPVPAFTMNDT